MFLLAGAASLSLPDRSFAEPISAKLYKDPNCGCCSGYAAYLGGNGFKVEVVATSDFAEIGRKAGVPQSMEGCHVTFIYDYAISGHVPLEAVRKLLSERPQIAGITLAGMPTGSPGMGGEKTEPFTVYAFKKGDGEPTVYATL
jgi:hypothetical protein